MLLSEFINLKEKPGCNMTEEGRACAVHGLTECPGYKMIETSVQDKLHQRHQEIRKKSGLPNPNYYKELRATFDLPDEERQAAVAAIKKKYKVNEAGPFSYGTKKPRKGSVADLAAKKRKEQEKDKQPVEPRDHMVGVARVVKDVTEAIPYGLSAANAAAEYQRQGNRHKGRIDIPVQSREDYLSVGQALTKAARAAGEKINFGLSDGVMSVFSDSMTADELDEFIDDVLDQGVAEGLRDPKDNPCWKGYKPVGTKKKAGKTVPNCVPTNEDIEQYLEELERAGYGLVEEKTRLDPKCWKGYRKAGTKMKGGVRVNNCVPVKKKVDEEIPELQPDTPPEKTPLKKGLDVLGTLFTAGKLLSDPKSLADQEIKNYLDPSRQNQSLIKRMQQSEPK